MPTPASPSRRSCASAAIATARSRSSSEFPGSFAAEGLAARLRLEDDEALRDAFAALDAGDSSAGWTR